MGTRKNLLAAAFVGLFFQVACGVKGDPVPPERPAELGRGKPSFKRAAERVKVVPQPKDPLEETDDDEDDEGER